MTDFTTYGAVPLEDFYVRRDADDELVERLGRFEYCYVLAPRQMGKSSMALRAAEALREKGVKTVSIDLQPLAGHDSALALWGLVARRLRAGLARCGVEVPLFSPTAADEAPGALWVDYMRDVVLPLVEGGLVVFFDEIDTLASCRFNTDPFFGSLRALHGERPADRFAVCLLGVTRPADLVLDEKTTPFNVAHPIALRDFTRREADAFLGLLEPLFAAPEALIAEAYAWTSGHPYMLQNVLREAVSERSKGGVDPSREPEALEAFVNRIVERRFFGPEEDAVLGVVRRMFEGPPLAPENIEALNHYRILLADKDVPLAQGPRRELQEKLRIAGLVAFVGEGTRTLLGVRNRIFRRRYNAAWVASLLDRPIYEAMAARWLQEDEAEDFLLRGAALDAAEAWVKAQEQAVSGWTAEFVNASRRLANRDGQREAKLWRRLFITGAVAVTLFVSLTTYGYVQRSEAARQSLEAQVAALLAQETANATSETQFNKEIEAVKLERANLEATANKSSAEIAELKQQHDDLEHEIETSKALSDQEKSFLRYELRLNESQAAAARDELDRAGKALDASKKREIDLTRDISTLRQKNASLQRQLETATQAATSVGAQLDSLKQQVAQLSARIGEAQGRYATCSDNLAKVKAERDAALAAKAASREVPVPPFLRAP